MTNNRRKKIFIFGIVFAVVGIVLIKIVISFSELRNDLKNDLPSTHVLDAADSAVINPKFKDRLRIIVTKNSKVRNPVSVAALDNRYFLFLHHLNSTAPVPILSFIQFEHGRVDQTVEYSYDVIDNDLYFKFEHNLRKLPTTSKLFMAFSDTSLRTLAENDTVLCFRSSSRQISIRYQQLGPVDFIIESKLLGARTIKIPVDIGIESRNNKLFMFFLIPADQNDTIPSRLLGEIMDYKFH